MIKKIAKLYVLCYLACSIVLGLKLIMLDGINDGVIFLKDDILQYTYLSRIILNLLAYTSRSSLMIFASIFNAVTIFELIIFCIAIVYGNYQKWLYFISELIVCILIITFALSTKDVSMITYYLHLLGWILIAYQSIFILYLLRSFMISLKSKHDSCNFIKNVYNNDESEE